MPKAAITATGHYVPPDVYPNAWFEQRLDTTDAWIRSRTGIIERRFASEGGASDRATAVLFGDGAGVVLVEMSEDDEVGVFEHVCHMDGEGATALYIPAGGSRITSSAESVAQRRHFVVQDGATVFKAAVVGMAEVTEELLKRADLTLEDVAWMVPHQANRRIIEAVARRLGLPLERVVINLDRYGNTVAATIPLCLSEWHDDGRLAYGDRVVLAAFGAGFTSGAVYLRWAIGA